MTNEGASKRLAYLLRHDRDLHRDPYGWSSVKDVLERMDIPFEELQKIVSTDSKSRYQIDGNLVRAVHGHSVSVEQSEVATPPEYLYHGTVLPFMDSILRQGLLPRGRSFVHLSETRDTAVDVGGRRSGELAVLCVSAGEMSREGYEFYPSLSGVWLTLRVPPEFLRRIR